MKLLKQIYILALSCLMACSSTHKFAENNQVMKGSRSIAAIDIKKDLSESRIKKTMKGIFHSYILGQVFLEDFDNALDRYPTQAMDKDVYSELLAVRILVDQFEENIHEMYVKLVLVSALPEYSEQQKAKAKTALAAIGSFMDGFIDNKEIPENLKYMILGNLREKQTILYDELKTISSDISVTNNNPEVISVIESNMVLLRATRMKFFKESKFYLVDKQVLNKTIAEQASDVDFKEFKSEVKKISKEIKKISKQMKKGRSTSSDVIFSSTTSAGNIVGNGFPANTWSLTYDDGPGSKTTPTVLSNLKKHNMKATFFMLAKQVEALPTTAKAVADAGMDIASHSYDHAQLTKVGAVALEKQIGGAKKIIETKLGKTLKLFRLPYGAGVNTAVIRAKIAEHNLIHVFWNVDTLDWQDKNPASILNRAVKQMKASPKNSGVVLFHDIHSQSVVASELLMKYFADQKINVCTVQAVVDQMNQGLATCQQ